MSLQFSAPSPGKVKHLRSIGYGIDSYLLSQARLQEPLLIITASAFDADRLYHEIQWFNPQLSIHLLPDWETLPYDHFSPHPDLTSTRLSTLYQITQRRCDVVITSATTSLICLPPPKFLAAHAFLLQKGQNINIVALRDQLAKAGYTHVSRVISPGEFSFRGGLIDLFPMGSVLPYRLDLFDTEIEHIRTFDVDTQRSLYPLNRIQLLPAHEYPLDESGIAQFRKNFRGTFPGDPSKYPIYKNISNGLITGGIEWYLPLFFDQAATLLDYLPGHTVVCFHGDSGSAIERFWHETQERYRLLCHDVERPILKPEHILLKADHFFSQMQCFPRVQMHLDDIHHETKLPNLSINQHTHNPIRKLCDFIHHHPQRILITAGSLGRRETMQQFFANHQLNVAISESWEAFSLSDEPVVLCTAPLQHGFITRQYAVITETELYTLQVKQERRREKSRTFHAESLLKNLAELHENDPVVHEQHGVGRYRGLVYLNLEGNEEEYLLIEYSDGDKLYVPVAQLFLVSRYSGATAESAPLHKLGSAHWDKIRKKAYQEISDTAAELLSLYALRASRTGHIFQLPVQDYEQFVAGFPFEETADQSAAIEAVIHDMLSDRPMDRLICGDVGFGKTEVALRAAFIAVMNGFQVAVLVPTTLLAEQHYHNFVDRFAAWPIKIADISRFKTAKEQSVTLHELAQGRVDIIVGTHRLIQQDVQFQKLGLVILDEEHRFGVQQKERFKALRSEVDILTLTATPIPRTMSMALEGLRDFSIIATPPQKRLSIKTFVTTWTSNIIKEAVMRELRRGGQIYFLHNEVESIYEMRDQLETMLPEARIAIAHGQLRERELEHVMRDFYHQRFNILLCTTIIETGIDVPSANTIIIHRADQFGLAQLHQLRGRVGRSHHQAYAYLLLNPDTKITAQAKQRLDAIQLMEDLGAGFHLAIHDLEIRGAGELLGASQAGNMQQIGYALYTEILANAVEKIKRGELLGSTTPFRMHTEVNLHTPALLPHHYCANVSERLIIYKRMAQCSKQEQLILIQEELIDRFGVLPEETVMLFACHKLRIEGQAVDIKKIEATRESVQLDFMPEPRFEIENLIQLLHNTPCARMKGSEKLQIAVTLDTAQQRIEYIRSIILRLT